MKVILLMAITANGYVARENDDTPWSDAEFKSFHSMVRKKRNIIVGRRTYELMKSSGDFAECNNPFTIVLTKHHIKSENNTTYVSSPIQAIEVMQSKGFKEVLLAGGGSTNAAFLRQGLIDEMILDIEPFIFGKGIKLFAESKEELNLELLKAQKLSKNTIRLHYKVKKK